MEAILTRAQNALADPRTKDQALANELNHIAGFVRPANPYVVAFLRARYYESVAQAVRRQFRSGKEQVSCAAALIME